MAKKGMAQQKEHGALPPKTLGQAKSHAKSKGKAKAKSHRKPQDVAQTAETPIAAPVPATLAQTNTAAKLMDDSEWDSD